MRRISLERFDRQTNQKPFSQHCNQPRRCRDSGGALVLPALAGCTPAKTFLVSLTIKRLSRSEHHINYYSCDKHELLGTMVRKLE